MTSVTMTRRGLVHSIALVAAFPAMYGTAFGAPAAESRVVATTAVLQACFPHRKLAPSFYASVAAAYVKEISANTGAINELDRGLAMLDANHMARFADLPPVIQKGLLKAVDQEPFFKAILWRGAELVYRDPKVWAAVGYQGSSVEFGGYHDRGFDDIDWLPKAGVKS